MERISSCKECGASIKYEGTRRVYCDEHRNGKRNCGICKKKCYGTFCRHHSNIKNRPIKRGIDWG